MWPSCCGLEPFLVTQQAESQGCQHGLCQEGHSECRCWFSSSSLSRAGCAVTRDESTGARPWTWASHMALTTCGPVPTALGTKWPVTQVPLLPVLEMPL